MDFRKMFKVLVVGGFTSITTASATTACGRNGPQEGPDGGPAPDAARVDGDSGFPSEGPPPPPDDAGALETDAGFPTEGVDASFPTEGPAPLDSGT